MRAHQAEVLCQAGFEISDQDFFDLLSEHVVGLMQTLTILCLLRSAQDFAHLGMRPGCLLKKMTLEPAAGDLRLPLMTSSVEL
jgi:hypothetical protein